MSRLYRYTHIGYTPGYIMQYSIHCGIQHIQCDAQLIRVALAIALLFTLHSLLCKVNSNVCVK